MPIAIGVDERGYKIATCPHCSTINKYLPNEVRLLWNSRDYGGGPDGAKGFDCAKCQDHVIVERW